MTQTNNTGFSPESLRLIGAALALHHVEGISASITPIPSTGRFVAIGTPAEVARLLEIAPASAQPNDADLLQALQNAARLLRAAGFTMNGTCSSKIVEAINKHASAQPVAAAPAGWTALSIIYNDDMEHPEEVAYGPKFMMDRLGKWLDKFMAQEIAQRDGAEDAARYRYIATLMDWSDIERMCWSTPAESAEEFKRGLDKYIDSKLKTLSSDHAECIERISRPAPAAPVAQAGYPLEEYQPGQWWIERMEALWGHGEVDDDTRRAAKVVCNFAAAVFAGRSAGVAQATTASASGAEDTQVAEPAVAPSKRREKLLTLADRIDHEKLWRRPMMFRDGLTDDQRDRLDAAVNLRRYADLLAPGRWLVLPPTGNLQFSAGSLEAVTEMAKRDQERTKRSGLAVIAHDHSEGGHHD